MSKLDAILGHFNKPRKMAKGEWMCKCPSHKDKTASLAIKEKSDGTVLLNCFAGCGALEILSALGLDWDSLYPDDGIERKPTNQRMSVRAATEILEKEAWIIFQYGSAYSAGEIPDNTRLLQATWNVNRVKELMGIQ